MKILMFGWEFPPYNSGGLGTACFGLTKGLARNGMDITFVVPYAAESPANSFLKLVATSDIKHIRVRKINSSLQPYMTSEGYGTYVRKSKANFPNIYGATLFDEVERFSKAAKEMAEEEDFDVIHCHDWMTFKAGLNAKAVKNRPLVLHVHATEFDRSGGNGVNQKVYDMERAGMHHADHIIAVSNYTKGIIVSRYGIPPEKVTAIHNAVDLSSYADQDFKKHDPRRIVLFLGRLTLQKGPDYFISAAKKVLEKEKNVRFVVAGTGDMEASMIERAAEMGIADRVSFAGFLPQHEVDMAYRMADVYVMPSVSEPFGITPLEAMKHNVPVIISKQSGVSEVISHCLKVDFWDIDEMSSKIISVLRYGNLHQALKENGSAEVNRFTWDVPAEKCIKVYESLLMR